MIVSLAAAATEDIVVAEAIDWSTVALLDEGYNGRSAGGQGYHSAIGHDEAQLISGIHGRVAHDRDAGDASGAVRQFCWELSREHASKGLMAAS